MIRHVVTFVWTPDIPAGQVDVIATELTTLAASLAGIESYACGADLGLGAGNADFAVVATFADQAAWTAYMDHPEHQRIRSELMLPFIAQRSAIQFAGDAIS